MKDNAYYEGEFQDGEINGKGIKFNPHTGVEYSGDFKDGQFQGKGKLKLNDQIYEGDFLGNMKHGYGELNDFKKNESFQGHWYYNKRHGQGTQKFADGSIYNGDWVHDRRQGYGDIKHRDGSVYDVSFLRF